MSTRCFSTATFYKTVDAYRKKTKASCDKVLQDISGVLGGTPSLQEFLKASDLIMAVEEGYRQLLIKTRIPNSAMKEGKKSRFRLISFLDFGRNSINLLDVYPKKGKFGKTDLSATEYESILVEYVEQLQNNTLTVRDPKKGLIII